MVRVGIISDTHDNLSAVDKALNEFESRNVKVLIHAGDIIAPFTLRRILARGFDFRGVFGNNDGEVVLLSRVAQEQGAILTPQPLLINIEGLSLLIMHGLQDLQETRNVVTRLANTGTFDVVVYGHTHEIDVRMVGRTLVVNPGEACGYLTGRKTIAILDTESKSVEIVEI
ncbi:MAG: metallophosphoesterase [Thermofilaceae archaeon]